MRAGLATSVTAHALLLAWGLVNLSSATPFEVNPTESLPIEILSPEEFQAMTKGSKTSKKVDAPKQKAEQVAAAEAEPVDEDTPVAKEDVKAPPPPAPAATEPVKAEAPPKPEPKPEPDAAKLAAEKAAKADAEKAAKAEAAKAEKVAQEKAAAEKAAKAEAAKVAQEKAEKLAQAAEAEKLAKAEAAEKAAQEKAEAEKVAKAEAEKAAKEKAEKLAKAEAEKAAKEKAEKLAKAEAEKAAKEKAEKLARAEAEKAKAAERKFDPSKIASLLGNKASSSDSAMKDVRDPSRKAASAREAAPETTAGTSRGTATKLSLSQRAGIDDAVREQVMQCWNPPIGASGEGSLAVRVTFTLNSDGTLNDGPTVVNSSSNPAFRAAAGAATRAVQRCAPLKLPLDTYDYWRQVTINFDPKDMMGG